MNWLTEDIHNKASRKEYGRQPYQVAVSDPDNPADEMSYTERMHAVTDKAMFNQSEERHSEMKKPYSSSDYPAMEHWYPPTFPTPWWPFPPFRGVTTSRVSDADGEFGGRGVPGDLPEPGERNPCGFEMRQQTCSQMDKFDELGPEDAIISGSKFPWAKYPYSAGSHFWSFEGVGTELITNIKITPPGIKTNPFLQYSVQYLSHTISFNWDIDKACEAENGYLATTLCYNIRGVCKQCVDISDYGCCKTCCEEDEPPEGVFTFDDPNTPDTIVKNASIDVYVLGGCGDFKYDASGTGYTWHSTGTNTVTSSNRNEQLDCADGT